MNYSNKIKKIKLGNFSIVFLTLLIIGFLITSQTDIGSISIEGLPAYLILLFSSIYILGYLFKFGIPTNHSKYIILLLYACSFFILTYSLLANEYEAFKLSVRLLIYGSIVFLFGNTKWNETKLLIISYLFAIISIVIFLQWLPERIDFKYAWNFTNPNTLGIVMHILIFIHLMGLFLTKKVITKTFFGIILLLDIILLYVSTSRSVWFSLLVSILIILLYRVLTSSMFTYKITFFIILFLILAFSYGYPKLYTLPIGWKLDDIVIDLTGKTLFTGRQIIWAQLLPFIEGKPILGNGIGMSSAEVLNVGSSAHNMYLSVLFQSGVIGLLLYIVILYLLWKSLNPNRKMKYVNKNILKLFPAFLVSLIIHQGFEMSFIDGPYPVTILEWIILAIGISLVSGNNEFKEERKVLLK